MPELTDQRHGIVIFVAACDATVNKSVTTFYPRVYMFGLCFMIYAKILLSDHSAYCKFECSTFFLSSTESLGISLGKKAHITFFGVNSTLNYIVFYLFCLAVIGTQTCKGGKEVKHWIQDFSIPWQNDGGSFVANVLFNHEHCGKIMFFTFAEVLFQFRTVQEIHLAVLCMPLDTFSASSKLSSCISLQSSYECF